MDLSDITPEERYLWSSTTLKRKIVANQRFHKYERTLRRIRLRIFEYEDAGKLDKAHRIIEKIKALCSPWWTRRAGRIADRHSQRLRWQ